MFASRMTMKNAPHSSASAHQRRGLEVTVLIRGFLCRESVGAAGFVSVRRARLAVLGHALDRRQARVPLQGDAGHPAGGFAERLGTHRVADLAAFGRPSTSPARSSTARCLTTATRLTASSPASDV